MFQLYCDLDDYEGQNKDVDLDMGIGYEGGCFVWCVVVVQNFFNCFYVFIKNNLKQDQGGDDLVQGNLKWRIVEWLVGGYDLFWLVDEL